MEARSRRYQGIRNRILFRWEGDLIEFVLAGDHDSIKHFLKTIFPLFRASTIKLPLASIMG